MGDDHSENSPPLKKTSQIFDVLSINMMSTLPGKFTETVHFDSSKMFEEAKCTVRKFSTYVFYSCHVILGNGFLNLLHKMCLRSVSEKAELF